MKSNDLSTLFTSQGGQPIEFRQGTILEWNQATGANQVAVGGSILTNVRVLNTGEAIALKPGHVVGILKSGTQWFIVGRISVPESTQFAGAAVTFKAVFNYQTGFAVPTTDLTVVSQTITVPDWANSCSGIVNFQCSANNTSAGLDNLEIEAFMDNWNSGVYRTAAVKDYWIAAAVSRAETFSVTPGGTFTCRGVVGSGNGWPAHADNSGFLTGLLMFKSTT